MWEGPDNSNSAQTSLQPKKAIHKAQKLLGDYNVPVDQVLVKTVAEKYGKIKDIVLESSRGLSDAIVLGRRASYTFQWIFDRPADETFQAMIKEQSCVSPLWICPDVDPSRKNVLLCIDGSENGCRAVDHVGFILSSQEQHEITLLHVENSVGTDCVEFFRRAEAILQTHKIDAKRINRNVIWGASVSNTILTEIQTGNFAVVALGMGGQKQREGRSRMAGGTTAKLISKIEKTSLWCCP